MLDDWLLITIPTVSGFLLLVLVIVGIRYYVFIRPKRKRFVVQRDGSAQDQLFMQQIRQQYQQRRQRGQQLQEQLQMNYFRSTLPMSSRPVDAARLFTIQNNSYSSLNLGHPSISSNSVELSASNTISEATYNQQITNSYFETVKVNIPWRQTI